MLAAEHAQAISLCDTGVFFHHGVVGVASGGPAPVFAMTPQYTAEQVVRPIFRVLAKSVKEFLFEVQC